MTPQQIVEELRSLAEFEIERAKHLFATRADDAAIDHQRKRVEAASLAYLSARAYAKLTEETKSNGH
jgi:hypothetical protein